MSTEQIISIALLIVAILFILLISKLIKDGYLNITVLVKTKNNEVMVIERFLFFPICVSNFKYNTHIGLYLSPYASKGKFRTILKVKEKYQNCTYERVTGLALEALRVGNPEVMI